MYSLKYDLIGLQLDSSTWINTLRIYPGEVLAEDTSQALNPTGIIRVGFHGYKLWTQTILESEVANWIEKPKRTVAV